MLLATPWIFDAHRNLEPTLVRLAISRSDGAPSTGIACVYEDGRYRTGVTGFVTEGQASSIQEAIAICDAGIRATGYWRLPH